MADGWRFIEDPTKAATAELKAYLRLVNDEVNNHKSNGFANHFECSPASIQHTQSGEPKSSRHAGRVRPAGSAEAAAAQQDRVAGGSGIGAISYDDHDHDDVDAGEHKAQQLRYAGR